MDCAKCLKVGFGQAWDTFQYLGRMGKGEEAALKSFEESFDLEPDNRYVANSTPETLM